MKYLCRRLTEGVGAWLHFEYLCKRHGLFDEKYLSSAVGQLLISACGEDVRGEYEHPILAAEMKGSGRRPSIDYVVCENKRIKVAVETKWAGSSHTTVPNIVWDLIRLESIPYHFKADCIFLLGGLKRDLTALFAQEDFRGPAGTRHRLPILHTANTTMLNLDLLPVRHYRNDLMREVFSDRQGAQIPEKLITQRSEMFSSDWKEGNYQVYAWKVWAAAPRKTFQPSSLRNYRKIAIPNA